MGRQRASNTTWAGWAVVVAVGLGGCADGDPPVLPPPASLGDHDPGDTGEDVDDPKGEDSDGDGVGDDDGFTSTDGDSAGGPMEPGSTSGAESGSDGGVDGTDATGDPFADPVMDACSPCDVAEDCESGLCVLIGTTATGSLGGFCSEGQCMNAQMDCSPAAGGGTATPMCMDIEIKNLPGTYSVCALSCANGETCPTGLSCVNGSGLPKVCA